MDSLCFGCVSSFIRSLYHRHMAPILKAIIMRVMIIFRCLRTDSLSHDFIKYKHKSLHKVKSKNIAVFTLAIYNGIIKTLFTYYYISSLTRGSSRLIFSCILQKPQCCSKSEKRMNILASL